MNQYIYKIQGIRASFYLSIGLHSKRDITTLVNTSILFEAYAADRVIKEMVAKTDLSLAGKIFESTYKDFSIHEDQSIPFDKVIKATDEFFNELEEELNKEQ